MRQEVSDNSGGFWRTEGPRRISIDIFACGITLWEWEGQFVQHCGYV